MAQGFTQKLRNVIAGVGLKKNNQTLSLDVDGLTEDSAPESGDFFVFYDTSEGVHNKVDFDSIGGGIRWSVDATTSSTLGLNAGVIANNAALHTGTLPATAAVGDRFGLATMNGQIRLGQNASQTVHFGNSSSTTGAGGYFESYVADSYSLVEVVCITANTDFMVVNSQGGFTPT